MFTIKSYAKNVRKRKYNPGSLFKVGTLRKRLKCVACGAKYWETEIDLTPKELDAINEKRAAYYESLKLQERQKQKAKEVMD
jgi:hypothetical protein